MNTPHPTVEDARESLREYFEAKKALEQSQENQRLLIAKRRLAEISNAIGGYGSRAEDWGENLINFFGPALFAPEATSKGHEALPGLLFFSWIAPMCLTETEEISLAHLGFGQFMAARVLPDNSTHNQKDKYDR